MALAELETVDLSSTRLTSKAIASLSTIPKLQRLYVNDDDVRYLQQLETPVANGDEISILPAVAGGAG